MEGNKPRKLIKRTVLTNPSLISYSVTSLFNPENPRLGSIEKALDQKSQTILSLKNTSFQKAREPEGQIPPRYSLDMFPKSNSVVKVKAVPYNDSLSKAEQDFSHQKQPQNRRESHQPKPQSRKQPSSSKKQEGASLMGRSSSTPLILPSIYLSSHDVKFRQNHGYNIISNYPSFQS